jgi:type IV secretory pathway VirB10-like protein
MPSRRATAAVLAALACATAAATTSGPALAQNAVEPVPGQPAPAPAPDTTTIPPVTTPPPATTTAPPAATTTAPVTPPPGQQPQQQDEDSGISWLAIAAIALGSILLGVLVVLALWRLRGWDPRWLKRWRHATAEAGWRMSLGWAEFRDFVRLGR